MHIYGKVAFENKICAWAYGSVVEEIYHKYKIKGKKLKKIVKLNMS